MPIRGWLRLHQPDKTSLTVHYWNSTIPTLEFSAPLFSIAGTSLAPDPHGGGVGIPTVASRNGEPGSSIVLVTDVEKGLFAYKAIPVNGNLVKIALPRIEGAMSYGRPVFGYGRVYVVDSKNRLVALGIGGNGTNPQT